MKKVIIKIFLIFMLISSTILTNFSIAYNNELKKEDNIDYNSNGNTENAEKNDNDEQIKEKNDIKAEENVEEKLEVIVEEKPEVKVEEKPEEKVEVKAEEKPEEKVEVKAEEKENKKTIEDGIYEICSAVDTDKAISIENNTYKNSTNIILNEENNLKRQKFQFIYDNENQAYIIKTLYNNMTLDVSGGIKEDWSNIQIYENNNTLAQQWEIKELENETYVIISKNSSKCIDIEWRKYTKWK